MTTSKIDTNNTDQFLGVPCECGHDFSEHRGIAECVERGCNCTQYHPVDKNKHQHRCEVCDREYFCSHHQCHPSDGVTTGICNICSKQISKQFRGDMFLYIFGASGDHILDRIRAKKLANDIHEAGLTVRILYESWVTARDIKGE